MKDNAYGTVYHNQVENEAQSVAEEVRINGWSRLEAVFEVDHIDTLRELIDETYAQQEAEFGRERLLLCQEADQARCLTHHDRRFFELIKTPRLKSIALELLGDYYTLMLQNAVLSRPDTDNHQTSWHRDLPYQNFVSNEPLAINILVVIDPFDTSSGSTELLPYSHQLSRLPSSQYIDKHKVVAIANPGDVLIFDSMLYHRAGLNHSNRVRRAINNQFSKPFIKPQYRLYDIVPSDFIEDEEDARVLGVTTRTLKDDREWRLDRIEKQQNNTEEK